MRYIPAALSLFYELEKHYMEKLIIRPAEAKDLETLFTFEQGVISAERPYDSTLKTGHIHYYDLKNMLTDENVRIVVAELGGSPVASGYARIEIAKPYLKHSHHAYLGFMYVDAQHRGKSINKKIIEALADWARSKNVLELRLEVYYGNEAAIRAYEKTGFEKHMIEMRMNTGE
jgi:GNAT superfamily N-acetyltransferase